MPKPILVDANIFLDLYEAGDDNALEVIKKLNGIKHLIFVSQQVVDEVNRNAIARVAATANKIRISNTKLQAGLGSSDDKDTKDKIKEANNAVSKAAEKVNAHLDKRIKSTAKLADPISKALEPIFKTAEKCTDEHLKRARLRLEVGNPPGKRDDPLGDQLTWEQFLDQVMGSKNVVLCTRDEDYFCRIAGTRLLHILLKVELNEKGVADKGMDVVDDLIDLLDAVDKLGLAKVDTSKLGPVRTVHPYTFIGESLSICPICGEPIVVKNAQMRTPNGLMFGSICSKGHQFPTDFLDS